jgi:hypothetical protein
VDPRQQPYLYEVDGGKPFALAGLWEQWWGGGDKDGPPLETWLETVRAGSRGARTLNLLDPFGSLLDEAIRRAQVRT